MHKTVSTCIFYFSIVGFILNTVHFNLYHVVFLWYFVIYIVSDKSRSILKIATTWMRVCSPVLKVRNVFNSNFDVAHPSWLFWISTFLFALSRNTQFYFNVPWSRSFVLKLIQLVTISILFSLQVIHNCQICKVKTRLVPLSVRRRRPHLSWFHLYYVTFNLLNCRWYGFLSLSGRIALAPGVLLCAHCLCLHQ